MNWIISIFQMANQNWTSRAFTLVLLAAVTYSSIQFFTAKAKLKCEDCKPYIEQSKYVQDQNKQLMDAFIKVKQIAEIQTKNPLSTAMIYFTISDTTPTQRKITRYVDSVLHAIQ